MCYRIVKNEKKGNKLKSTAPLRINVNNRLFKLNKVETKWLSAVLQVMVNLSTSTLVINLQKINLKSMKLLQTIEVSQVFFFFLNKFFFLW